MALALARWRALGLRFFGEGLAGVGAGAELGIYK